VIDIDAINRLIQSRLHHLGRANVTAVEAALWLDEAGLLADSRARPGKPLRVLLRAGRVPEGRQHGRFWYIHVGSIESPELRRPPVVSAVAPSTGLPALASAELDTASLPSDPRFLAAFVKVGFQGFVNLGDAVASRRALMVDHSRELTHCGVYAVFAPLGWQASFVVESDLSNVITPWPLERLQSRWIDGVELVYIGCAGATQSSRTLAKRLSDLLKHAEGRVTASGPHKGGERLWQCRGWEDWTLAWRASDPYPAPHAEEVAIGSEFMRLTGALPFANVRL